MKTTSEMRKKLRAPRSSLGYLGDAVELAPVLLDELEATEADLKTHLEDYSKMSATVVRLESMLDAAETRLKEFEWRDISTAPDDGIGVQIYVPENRCIYTAYRVSTNNNKWHIFGGGCREHLQRATHWMPLPEPPT